MASRDLGTTVAPAGEKDFDLRVVPVMSVVLHINRELQMFLKNNFLP